jgi:hypothetical protein
MGLPGSSQRGQGSIGHRIGLALGWIIRPTHQQRRTHHQSWCRQRRWRALDGARRGPILTGGGAIGALLQLG